MPTKYPDSLPTPSTWRITPRDLRLHSSGTDGAPQVRRRSVDPTWSAEAVWTLSPTEAAEFEEWVRSGLHLGRSWGEMPVPWPCAPGVAQRQIRMHALPTWRHLGAGAWQVSASLDVRGRAIVSGIVGQMAGTVAEDGATAASGTVQPASSGATVVPVAGVAGVYGTFSISSAGVWTYSLANASSAVQALQAGERASDPFAISTTMGDLAQVVITVIGANDSAVIGGVSTGSVAEDGQLTASGQLTIADADAGQAAFISQSATLGTYGVFSISASGAWIYTLANGAQSVQSLAGAEVVTDRFTTWSADRSASVDVVITVTGASDQGSITGALSGAVVEDGQLTASGVVRVNDAPAWVTITPGSGITALGAWSITASGAWTYTLANGSAAVQALVAGQSVVEHIAISATDGAASQITVTVTGAQDTPVIGGVSTGSVAEDGQLTASGQLTIADADAGQAAFFTQSATSGTYGSFSITASGAWTYTLNNASSAVQSLVTGQQVTDTFQAHPVDGAAPQPVVITVTGADELPVAGNPPWSTVFLLLHANIPVGNIAPGAVTDSSSYARSIAVGNLSGTASGKFSGGLSMLHYNAPGIYTTSGVGADIGTGDFTVEFWFRSSYTPPATAARPPHLFSPLAGYTATSLRIWMSRGNSFDGAAGSISLALPTGGGIIVTTGTPVTDDQWHHIAVSRAGGVSRIFVDGALKQSAADANNYAQWAASGFYVGAGDALPGSSTVASTSTHYTGTLDEIRMCKYGLYTATFSPPTAPFPNS